MIETKLRKYLKDNTDISVYLEVPENPPDKMIILDKTSGSGKPYMRTAQFAIQSYADTLNDAAELATDVNRLMEILAERDPDISKCELNAGPYPFNDPETKKHRYQAVYDLIYFDD